MSIRRQDQVGIQVLLYILTTAIIYPIIGLLLFQKEPSILGRGLSLSWRENLLLWGVAFIGAGAIFGANSRLKGRGDSSNQRTLFFSLVGILASYDYNVFGITIDRTAAGFIRTPLLVAAIWGVWPALKAWTLRATDGFPQTFIVKTHPSRSLFLSGALLYFMGFLLLTYPQIYSFSTELWADSGDGLQMYWNVWWFQKAVLDLKTNPWFTQYLHFPNGVNLLGASFHPLKSAMAIPFLSILSQQESYNVLVILTFVLNGLSAQWLAYSLSGSRIGSLIGGFIFAFSNNRFAHVTGHMHSISSEWIPIFLLLWIVLLERPRIKTALGASLALFCCLLSDQYAFLFAAIGGALWFAMGSLKHRNWRVYFIGDFRRPVGAFLISSISTSGAVIGLTLYSSISERWWGSHSPMDNSMDLFGIFIPGGHWRFNEWTRGFWEKNLANYHEASVHLGLSVLWVLFYLWKGRRRIPSSRPWFSVFFFFWFLSLGAHLNIWGRELPLGLPYNFLIRNIPGFNLSGVPVRFFMMVCLAASILVAQFFALHGTRRWWFSPFLILLVFESLPSPAFTTRLEQPPYVEFLKKNWGAVIDVVADQSMSLYYQTVHEKPSAFGYVARISVDLISTEGRIRDLVNRYQTETLKTELGFRYVVDTNAHGAANKDWADRIVFRDSDTVVIDLAPVNRVGAPPNP